MYLSHHEVREGADEDGDGDGGGGDDDDDGSGDDDDDDAGSAAHIFRTSVEQFCG